MVKPEELQKESKDSNLKDILGHAGEAVVSYARAAWAHADLSNLVRLTEIGCPLHPHHTNHSWRHTVVRWDIMIN